jgi:apolipoprotein N-acyltransferase
MGFKKSATSFFVLIIIFVILFALDKEFPRYFSWGAVIGFLSLSILFYLIALRKRNYIHAAEPSPGFNKQYILGLLFYLIAFIWLFAVKGRVGDDFNLILYVAIIPCLVLMLAGSVSFAFGVYASLNRNKSGF